MPVVVLIIVAILYGLLAHPASGQTLPAGVTYVDGVYHVKRSALKKFKRSDIRTGKEIVKANGIKYKIVN